MIACARLPECEADLQASEEDKTEKTLPLSTTTENLQI